MAIFSGGADAAFFCISRDHMINESHDSEGEIPSPWTKKFTIRITELSNKNIYALQTGAASFYYKLGQTLLQIGAAFRNQGNCYYKIAQLLQIGAKFIPN